jgi:prophage tail gpP-like protein
VISDEALVVYESMFGNTELMGLREWMAAPPPGEHAAKIATFDTKIESMRHMPGWEAKGAAKAARKLWYKAATAAGSLYVRDVDGPLVVGEVDRARAWAQQLAASVSTVGS